MSDGARKWAERIGKWETVLRRDVEGMAVKSELLAMWKLKLTRVRAKLGLEEAAVAAQHEAIASAPLPPPREGERAAAILKAVRQGRGADASGELMQELQRQMVEAERWRAETKKVAVQLKRARDEMSRKVAETATMRSQNVTWSSDNRAKREELRAARRDVEELRDSNAAVVAQASMLEDQVAKLQDELTLKSELAAMWRRSSEKTGNASYGEAEAAAVTWKLEAEKSMQKGEKWKGVARRAEELARTKEDEVLRLKAELQQARAVADERRGARESREAAERPQEEIAEALASAQEDLEDKAREAERLNAKVARLEEAIRHLA